MKKRLRKKLHTGDHAEFGFKVDIALLAAPPDTVTVLLIEQIMGRLLKFCDQRDLAVGGGGNVCGRWLHFFVSQQGHGSPTEADRAAVSTFLHRHADWFKDFTVHAMENAWYGRGARWHVDYKQHR